MDKAEFAWTVRKEGLLRAAATLLASETADANADGLGPEEWREKRRGCVTDAFELERLVSERLIEEAEAQRKQSEQEVSY